MGTTLRSSRGNLEELSSCTEHELEKGTLSKVYGVQIDATNCRVLKQHQLGSYFTKKRTMFRVQRKPLTWGGATTGQNEANSYSQEGPMTSKYLLKRCFEHVFGVQIPNLRRWQWMSREWYQVYFLMLPRMPKPTTTFSAGVLRIPNY